MTRAEDRPVFDWACRAIGDGARMVWSRRLVGGITSTMRALTIADATGRLHRVVLRTPDHPGHDEDDDDDVTQWFRREADILRMLGPTSIPAPS